MKKELIKSLQVLHSGGVILYPTDTVWGIGCDATNELAVEKVFEIKQRSASKSLIILVDDWKMLQRYIEEIPEKVSCILESSSKPTTVIYKNPIGLAKNVIASDNTVAIRIVKDKFCRELIHQFGAPFVSTSANVSGSATPVCFKEITDSIIENVDYIVRLKNEESSNLPSRIIKVNKNGNIITLRD